MRRCQSVAHVSLASMFKAAPRVHAHAGLVWEYQTRGDEETGRRIDPLCSATTPSEM